MTVLWKRVRAHPWVAVLSLLLAASVVGAACGGGGDGGDGGDGDSGAPADGSGRPEREAQAEPAGDESDQGRQAEPSAEGSEAQPSAAPARVGGELRIARGEPITLDPALTTDANSASYVVEIFGGLVTLDQDLNIVPDLAEALPQIINNPDGSVTYRFVLRRDARFQNGQRVRAADVKWSLERNASPETFSPTAIDYLGDIVGAREYIRGRIEEITGIVVIDELTLEITIDGPKPYFLAKLTYPTAFVLDRGQVEADPQNWTRNPNGTGPFRLQEWHLGEQMVLVPNEFYHLGKAGVESVRIRFAGGGLTQYENEEVDIAGVGINDIERVKDPASALNAEFVSRSELSVFYLGFNVDQPPFDDALVRRAFAMAIDKRTLVEVVLQNVAALAQGILPPGLTAHDPDFVGIAFDAEGARALLEQSSYAGRLPNIRLTTSGGGATPGAIIEAIQEMWRQNLDVQVEIQQVETANFFSDLDRGLYQLFDIGWILDYPDPENVLDLKFHGRSRQNDTQYDNPALNQLLEEARVEQDPQVRIELYREAERLIVEDAVWSPLFFGQQKDVIKPYVQGYVPPRSVIPYLRFITLSE